MSGSLLEARKPDRACKNRPLGYGFGGTKHLTWARCPRKNQTKYIPRSGSSCNVYIANTVFLLLFITKCKTNELNKTSCKIF